MGKQAMNFDKAINSYTLYTVKHLRSIVANGLAMNSSGLEPLHYQHEMK